MDESGRPAGRGDLGREDPGPTPAVQHELAELERAIVQVDRKTLHALGGIGAASRRVLTLRQLPTGTTLNASPRGSIDRYTTWSTSRLISPEGAG